MGKIKVVEVDTLPKCPHCGKEIDTIERINKGIFSSVIIYICPLCKKILSVDYTI